MTADRTPGANGFAVPTPNQRYKPKGERRRPTPAQLEERAAHAAHLLSRFAYKHQIFRMLKARYGVSARTCERVLARARELLAEQAGRTREDFRRDGVAFYLSVIRDARSSVREQMEAMREILRVVGGYAPLKVAATDGEGNDRFEQSRSWVNAALKHPRGAELLAELAELELDGGAGGVGGETSVMHLPAEYGLRELPHRNGDGRRT
jgi:hypothetical protein